MKRVAIVIVSVFGQLMMTGGLVSGQTLTHGPVVEASVTPKPTFLSEPIKRLASRSDMALI